MKEVYVLMYLEYYTTEGSTETYSGGGILGVFDTLKDAEKEESLYGMATAIIKATVNKPEEIEGVFK